MPLKTSASIVYFQSEGKAHLRDVIRVVKRYFKRNHLPKGVKVMVFTGFGEGAALAYNQLQEYEPKIIAITFPPTFIVRRKDAEPFNPQIHPKLLEVFRGVKIDVVTCRLPFDEIEGVPAQSEQVKLIKDVLSIFGGSFALLVQGILQACDTGLVDPGERVIGVTGDCAAVVTAAPTIKFLLKDGGLEINEILCKPREFDLSRKKPTQSAPAPSVPAPQETKALAVPHLTIAPTSKEDA